jgi:hypothetical protein
MNDLEKEEGYRRGRYRGGRPKRGMPNRKNTVRHHVVVDDDLWQMLEVERHAEETNNDALWRMLTFRTKKIENLRKKVDALESLVQQEQQKTPAQVVQS